MFAVLIPLLIVPQQVPSGVRYAKAEPKVNAIAEKKLHAIFDKKPTTADYSPIAALPLIIGPNLWGVMKPGFSPKFATAKKVNFIVPNAKEVQTLEGRMPRTAEQVDLTFGAASFIAERGSKPTIRKANKDELQYYWAIISFDITEPVYVIDCGKSRFIFDFEITHGDPHVMFIELLPSRKK